MIDRTAYPEHALQAGRAIRLLTLDVDGVLSNGQLLFSNSGEELKGFSTLDGQGIKLLQHCGVEVAVITGRSSDIVARRAKALGIASVIQGREDKLPVALQLLEERGLTLEQLAHVGDDWPDLPIIVRAGLGCSVPNGHVSVRQRARYVTQHAGGEGAVREVADLILHAQGHFDQVLAEYL